MRIDDDFEHILARVLAGDEAAATALFQAYQPRLLRYLRSQEPRVADDLAAEVWLAVAGSLGEFRGDAAGFRGWVFTIARRRVIEHRRRGIRRRTDSVDPDAFAERAAADDPAGAAVGGISAQDAIGILNQVLSPVQAEVLVLRVVADLDTAAVAAIFGRSESWVRVTQHRALKRLAGRLDLKEVVTP